MLQINDNVVKKNCKYTVGTNDGFRVKNATFVGKELINGKPFLMFKRKKERDVAINISYCTFLCQSK